jgi:hypothetical protein
MNEIRGEIEENWKFNGQLMVKLHKSKSKDQNEKTPKYMDKLHNIKSLNPIRGVIERNHKSND